MVGASSDVACGISYDTSCAGAVSAGYANSSFCCTGSLVVDMCLGVCWSSVLGVGVP